MVQRRRPGAVTPGRHGSQVAQRPGRAAGPEARRDEPDRAPDERPASRLRRRRDDARRPRVHKRHHVDAPPRRDVAPRLRRLGRRRHGVRPAQGLLLRQRHGPANELVPRPRDPQHRVQRRERAVRDVSDLRPARARGGPPRRARVAALDRRNLRRLRRRRREFPSRGRALLRDAHDPVRGAVQQRGRRDRELAPGRRGRRAPGHVPRRLRDRGQRLESRRRHRQRSPVAQDESVRRVHVQGEGTWGFDHPILPPEPQRRLVRAHARRRVGHRAPPEPGGRAAARRQRRRAVSGGL